MINLYDIAIIGLGPAGATLARLLDRKYKVVAIDKKNSKITKCCGGLLSPDAQKILAQFDICLPKDVLVDPQIFSVRTIDLDNNIEKYYQRFYLNMDRAKFDNFLISLIPDNVKIYKDSFCTKIEKQGEYYGIEIKTNGKKEMKKAKIVIGADGANSIVRNTFYGKNKIKKYFSIQEWYSDYTDMPFYSCIFCKRITDSYSWTITKDNNIIIGGAFPIKDCRKRFEMLKEKMKDNGLVFGNMVKRESCFVYLNKNIMGTCTGKNGLYLIGEAAGMISPSSLEGISYSMESAKILAKIINSYNGNIAKRYFMKTLMIRIKLYFKILKIPFMYNTILRRIVMKSGLSAIKK